MTLRRKNMTPETAQRIRETLKAKQPMTREQMLSRVPREEYLTTEHLERIFDVHPVTIYKWVRLKQLRAFRVRAHGKANVYRREDVVALINSRFQPQLHGASTDVVVHAPSRPVPPKPKPGSKAAGKGKPKPRRRAK